MLVVFDRNDWWKAANIYMAGCLFYNTVDNVCSCTVPFWSKPYIPRPFPISYALFPFFNANIVHLPWQQREWKFHFCMVYTHLLAFLFLSFSRHINSWSLQPINAYVSLRNFHSRIPEIDICLKQKVNTLLKSMKSWQTRPYPICHWQGFQPVSLQKTITCYNGGYFPVFKTRYPHLDG